MSVFQNAQFSGQLIVREKTFLIIQSGFSYSTFTKLDVLLQFYDQFEKSLNYIKKRKERLINNLIINLAEQKVNY